MTPDTLAGAIGCSPALAELYAEPMTLACTFYDISTPARKAAFFAQIGHESGSLRWATEVWGPTTAQLGYEGRADLGNTMPGDGERFKGHGLIQITGRANHARVRDRLRANFPLADVPDFEVAPHRLAEPLWAALSAADYWDEHGLNALADEGEIVKIGRAINRGDPNSTRQANGEANRLARYDRAELWLA